MTRGKYNGSGYNRRPRFYISPDRIKNSKVVVPSLFTLANMAFGFFAILAAMSGDCVKAVYCILFSYIMDVLDGRIARMLHAESPYGVEMDSFSDLVSFGVAPAIMMYQFALKDYNVIGSFVALMYVICGALRLIRFNVKANAGLNSKNFFQGLPIPGAAGIMLSIVLAYTLAESSGPRSIPWMTVLMPYIYSAIPFIVILLALLMVSNMPYVALKGHGVRLSSPKMILLLIAVFALICTYPQNALFIFFSIYAVSGVLVGLYLSFRKLFRHENI